MPAASGHDWVPRARARSTIALWRLLLSLGSARTVRTEGRRHASDRHGSAGRLVAGLAATRGSDRHRRSPTEDELVAVDNVGAIDSAAAAWEVGRAGRAGLDRGLWVQGPFQREGPRTEIPGRNVAERTGTCSMSTDVRHRELRSRRPSSAPSTSRRWDQGARSRGRGAVTGVRSSVGWLLVRARRWVDNRADVKRGSHVTNWAHDRQGDCESVCLRGRLLRNSIKPRALWAGEGSGPQSRRTSSWSAPRAGLGGDLQESAGASSYRS